MPYFTKSQARAAAQGSGLRKGAGKAYDRMLRESVTAATDADSFDIFAEASFRSWS